MSQEREFLFTYRFAGREWGTSVFAASPAEAKEKIKAQALARYDGELYMRIPAAGGLGGWVARLFVSWKSKASDHQP